MEPLVTLVMASALLAQVELARPDRASGSAWCSASSWPPPSDQENLKPAIALIPVGLLLLDWDREGLRPRLERWGGAVAIALAMAVAANVLMRLSAYWKELVAERSDPNLYTVREVSDVLSDPFEVVGRRVGCVRPRPLRLPLRCRWPARLRRRGAGPAAPAAFRGRAAGLDRASAGDLAERCCPSPATSCTSCRRSSSSPPTPSSRRGASSRHAWSRGARGSRRPFSASAADPAGGRRTLPRPPRHGALPRRRRPAGRGRHPEAGRSGPPCATACASARGPGPWWCCTRAVPIVVDLMLDDPRFQFVGGKDPRARVRPSCSSTRSRSSTSSPCGSSSTAASGSSAPTAARAAAPAQALPASRPRR